MREENFIGNAKKATDFLGNTYEYDCMGCAITRKDIVPPGNIIYENESFIVSPDPEIPINGFLIIQAKKHINSLTMLSQEERIQFITLVNIGISAIKKLDIAKEVTLVQEERAKHFHLWIFPSQDWMIEKFGKGVTYLRQISSYAKENATEEDKKKILENIDRIREFFKKEVKQHNLQLVGGVKYDKERI